MIRARKPFFRKITNKTKKPKLTKKERKEKLKKMLKNSKEIDLSLAIHRKL